MPYSHHSHSGQFCPGHAVDQLEDIVLEAIRQKFRVFALTEHMPRNKECDLYPEEVAESQSPGDTARTFAPYYAEARRLQAKYADQIELLVGIEVDWIRGSFQHEANPSECAPSRVPPSAPSATADSSEAYIKWLLSQNQYDLFVGSVHHVHGIPIDYDQSLYLKAVQASLQQAETLGVSANGEELLFSDYYDAQLAMLEALKPPVVGHFDLIGLMSSEKLCMNPKRFDTVWQKVLRNLHFVAEYGGVLEVNSAGLRKGMSSPYPHPDIVKTFRDMGGKFVLSDDSHGVKQVGVCYEGVRAFLTECGLTHISSFVPVRPGLQVHDPRFPSAAVIDVKLEDVWKEPFWRMRSEEAKHA